MGEWFKTGLSRMLKRERRDCDLENVNEDVPVREKSKGSKSNPGWNM
jgi:hypothetical protein